MTIFQYYRLLFIPLPLNVFALGTQSLAVYEVRKPKQSALGFKFIYQNIYFPYLGISVDFAHDRSFIFEHELCPHYVHTNDQIPYKGPMYFSSKASLRTACISMVS